MSGRVSLKRRHLGRDRKEQETAVKEGSSSRKDELGTGKGGKGGW